MHGDSWGPILWRECGLGCPSTLSSLALGRGGSTWLTAYMVSPRPSVTAKLTQMRKKTQVPK